MRYGSLDEVLINKWADLLVDYCLRVEPGETIGIGSELAGRPLVEACYRAVVDRGGLPDVRVELPGLAEYLIERGSPAVLARTPEHLVRAAECLDGRIRIAAETDALAPIDPNRQAMRERALEPLRAAMRRSRWVLTQFPTPLYARDAGMSLDDYAGFVARALFLDQPDPAQAWQALGRRQAGLAEFMSRVRSIRIEGPGTDLSLEVGGRTWINSDGRRNMPSGEIFTGPIENSASGRIRCAYPVRRSGREMRGIALEFQDGKVVHATAEDGLDFLSAMLDMDAGARYLGELGIGLNSGIDRFTGSILFDEKIGGTIHVALGQSYSETGGTNNSALHWDLIVDLRQDGRVTADGQVVMVNGQWLVG